MRLVDIHLGADRRLHLRLDRHVTVVVADGPARARLIEGLSRAFVLAGTGVGGTVDAGEYLTPLDPTAVVALDLPGEGLPVLGPERLPVVDDREWAERRRTNEDRRAHLAAELARATAVTAAARDRVRLATTAVDVGRRELADAGPADAAVPGATPPAPEPRDEVAVAGREDADGQATRRERIEELTVRARAALAAERSALADAEEEESELAGELAEVDAERRRLELEADGLGPEGLRALARGVEDLVAAASRGSVPVVLDDLLRPVGHDAAATVLGLVAAGDGPQVLYVTADRALGTWAHGADGVGVAELRGPGWLRRRVARHARTA